MESGEWRVQSTEQRELHFSLLCTSNFLSSLVICSCIHFPYSQSCACNIKGHILYLLYLSLLSPLSSFLVSAPSVSRVPAREATLQPAPLCQLWTLTQLEPYSVQLAQVEKERKRERAKERKSEVQNWRTGDAHSPPPPPPPRHPVHPPLLPPSGLVERTS